MVQVGPEMRRGVAELNGEGEVTGGVIIMRSGKNALETIDAVKHQFPDKKIYGVLELHTYSSLNEAFMKEYEGVMNAADEGAVFYSKHALELKRMPDLPREVVQQGFHRTDLKVFNEKTALDQWLQKNNYHNSVVVLMSSGNYDGLDVEQFAKRITQSSAS